MITYGLCSWPHRSRPYSDRNRGKHRPHWADRHSHPRTELWVGGQREGGMGISQDGMGKNVAKNGRQEESGTHVSGIRCLPASSQNSRRLTWGHCSPERKSRNRRFMEKAGDRAVRSHQQTARREEKEQKNKKSTFHTGRHSFHLGPASGTNKTKCI